MDTCQLESIVERMNNVYTLLEDDYDKILKDIQLHESSLMNKIDTDLDDLSQRFEAAKRGLGIVNKLSASNTKLKHTQRIMGNLSKLRTQLLNLENKVRDLLGK